jgi:chemotaxis protein CheX
MTVTLSLKDVLLDSAREVFESMVFLALEEVEETVPDVEDVTFLGTITFMGDVEGCLGVCFSHPCARDIAAGMLCLDSPDSLSDDDVIDAIGEIANMVMGTIKTHLQDQVQDLSISIPSVIQGRQLRNRPGDGTIEVIVHARIGSAHHATFSLLYRDVGGASAGGA